MNKYELRELYEAAILEGLVLRVHYTDHDGSPRTLDVHTVYAGQYQGDAWGFDLDGNFTNLWRLDRIIKAEPVKPSIRPRNAMHTRPPLKPGHGRSIVWTRLIFNQFYTFTYVLFEDENGHVTGERVIVGKYNGYGGGPRFACGWSPYRHFTTIKA